MTRAFAAGVVLAAGSALFWGCNDPGGPRGIDFDLTTGELFVASEQALAGAVYVYAPDADLDDSPIRAIAGDDTVLTGFVDVAVDPVAGEIFVLNNDRSVVVHRIDAQGDATPLRVLVGVVGDTGEARLNRLSLY